LSVPAPASAVKATVVVAGIRTWWGTELARLRARESGRAGGLPDAGYEVGVTVAS